MWFHQDKYSCMIAVNICPVSFQEVPAVIFGHIQCALIDQLIKTQSVKIPIIKACLCESVTSILNHVGATRWYPRMWTIDSHFSTISLLLQGKELPQGFRKSLSHSHHLSGGCQRHRRIEAKSLPDVILLSQFPGSSTECCHSLSLLKPNEEVFKMRLQAGNSPYKPKSWINLCKFWTSLKYILNKKNTEIGFPDT